MTKTAKIIKKIDIRATLMTFSQGDEKVIPESESRYSTIYTIARDIEKKEGRKYLVSIDNIPSGTLVRRLA